MYRFAEDRTLQGVDTIRTLISCAQGKTNESYAAIAKKAGMSEGILLKVRRGEALLTEPAARSLGNAMDIDPEIFGSTFMRLQSQVKIQGNGNHHHTAVRSRRPQFIPMRV